MGQITIDQSYAIMAILTTNARWEEIDFEISRLQDSVIRDPQGAGGRFTDFLKNGCQFAKSILTKPFNPAEFIGEEWTVWKGPDDGDGLSGEEDIDPRSLALVKIEVSQFLFETCLQASDDSITGEEKLRRLKAASNFTRFGANVFFGLWLDYKSNKENSVLERLYQERKVTYLDFPGTVLRAPIGHRNVLCLCRDVDGQWGWCGHWLAYGWSAADLSAGCAS
ncbi:MAG: hypothetical protein Q8Q23_01115 [bacterium]|nr:hypothetical protein [bacterium]